jgi:serine/threonine-protein kinase HipA
VLGPRGSSPVRDCGPLLSSTQPRKEQLLDVVIFNYLVGNNDAHGKNFSLLYHGAGTPDLSDPAFSSLRCREYRVVPRAQPQYMAMKIGGEYFSEKVAPRNFDQLAEEAGLGKRWRAPACLKWRRRLSAALERGRSQIRSEKVAALIRQRAETQLERC